MRNNEVRLKPATEVRLKPDTTSEIRYAALATLALFVVLAVLHTWPLASAPGTLSRNDNGDFILHEWIMAWVSHQVVTNPLHLFDANIFYPEPYTLAYSDHLFVQSMLGAPFLWAGASPVLVHNLVLMAGFALTGYGQESDVRRARDAGYVDHFVKPLDARLIDQRIRSRLVSAEA